MSLASGVDELVLIFAADEAGLDLAHVRPAPREASMRRRSDSLDISSEKTATTLPSLTRGILRDVDGPRGFAHGGARGNDDELGLLQAAGHAVEVVEVRGQAGDFALQLPDRIDGAEVLFDDGRDVGEAAGDAALGDFEQRAFGSVEDLQRLFALVGGRVIAVVGRYG